MMDKMATQIINSVTPIRFSQRLIVEHFIHVLTDVKVLFFSTWSFLGACQISTSVSAASSLSQSILTWSGLLCLLLCDRQRAIANASSPFFRERLQIYMAASIDVITCLSAATLYKATAALKNYKRIQMVKIFNCSLFLGNQKVNPWLTFHPRPPVL
jgi:hypothetical protein